MSARAQDWNLDRDPGGGGRPCRDPARKVGVIAALPRVQWERQRGNPLSAETGMLAASECFRPPGPARWTGAPGGDPRAGVAQRHRTPVAHASGFRPDCSKCALVPAARSPAACPDARLGHASATPRPRHGSGPPAPPCPAPAPPRPILQQEPEQNPSFSAKQLSIPRPLFASLAFIGSAN